MAETTSRSEPGPGSGAAWLVGGGEMGAHIRAFDWAQTPIGPIESWSPTLRTMVRMLLANRFPMLLWWGPQYVSIYNDAYRPVLGTKHPWALGRPVSECWSEIWHILRPLIDAPFRGGPSTWNDDIELEINRYGFVEETHFTVAYSPVPDEAAESGIGGVLATVTETTEKVVGERRIVVLRDLGYRSAEAKTAEEACAIAAEMLAKHAKDVPFALIYLLDPDSRQARLAGAAGAVAGEAISPRVVDLESPADVSAGWPLTAAGNTLTIEDLPARFAVVPPGPWADPPGSAVVLPIPSSLPQQTAGYLVVGVSARLKLDERYRDFLELMKIQIATAIGNARAYEEERRRAEALAELDRAKTTFFSNVSHEFRTPLTLMLGPLEDALASDGLGDADRDRLALAHRNSTRLLKLVNTLLDFSRIESGRVQAVYEPIDLAQTTAGLADVFRAATERAGLRFVVDCPPLSEPAFVDREMWEKIVLNLLSNAFKFTHEGEIAVALRAVDGNFELTVRDTGTGIPAHEMPKLFERFHRVSGARGRTHEGSGIGLALVQELARLHRGSVSAQSDHGKGSTFTVTIPKGCAHLPAEQIGAERPQPSTALGAKPFIEEALRWLPDSDTHEERAAGDVAAWPDADPSPGARASILVAEDNADMRDYLRRLLAPRYDLEVVADGEAALAAVARRKPDVVLSDVMMPRVDGMELLARLRADPQTSAIPVILLSARAGEESRVEGMRSGADDYLIKPFAARELLARVDAHLRLARLRGEIGRALRESEERFRVFVMATSDVVYRMSADWREMRYLHGKNFVSDTENPSLGWLKKYIHPDDQARVLAAIREAIRAKSTFELEHPIIRVDGTLGWIRSRAIPLLGVDGEIVEWFGAGRDITGRKRAEETQQLLLGELNHRVKNTLAAVQAIAHQTLRRARDPAEFAASFSGRIQSMARVHSLLSSRDWKGADLRDVIRDQLLLGAVDNTRVTIWGPPVHLEPQMALHLALMLHELGTNSIKYGALSKPEGVATIGWAINGDVLRLEWIERGGPPVRTPMRRGFGTTLIEQTAKSEGGSARMVVEAETLRWEIALPLPRPTTARAASRTSADLARTSLPSHAAPAGAASAPLAGRRILVVEDEPLIALDIVAALEHAGAAIVGPVGTVDEALQVIERAALDGALLDANLRGQHAGSIAAALTRRKISFVFVTGYGRETLPPGFGEAPLLAKPFSEEELLEAAAKVVRQPAAIARLRE